MNENGKCFFFAGAKSLSLHLIYYHKNKMIESMTKIIHTIMLRVSVPIIVLQFIIWSFVQYIRSDLANNSFHLIYPWT